MPGKASSKPAGKFKVSGGSGHMKGPTGVGLQKPGITATSSGPMGKGIKVSGGSGHMAGPGKGKGARKA